MDFIEKYEMYKSVIQGDIEILKTRLIKNVEESSKSLLSNVEVNDKIKYLIDELLEDKEHLDAFIAANTERPY